MTAGRLFRLVRLRYRILWAQARGSPSGIAWFAAVQFVLVLAFLLAVAGGLGAAAAAAATGGLEAMGRTLLGGMYLNALIASVLLGFGLNQVFSDAVLRRYPLSRLERMLVRQVLGLAEPFWLLTFALYLGCAAGASMLGGSSIWLGVPAALLLIATNFLVARVLLALAERLFATTIGSFVLIVLIQLVGLLPLVLARFFEGPIASVPLMAILRLTPPFAAASIMGGAEVSGPLAILVVWTLALAAGLLVLESYPVRSRPAAGPTATGAGAYDRIAALFPRPWAPLVARGLRYFLRCPKVRVNLVVTLPVLVFLLVQYAGRRTTPMAIFERAVALSPLAGTLAITIISENLFGFDGSGFRRLTLSPARASTVLRATAMAPLLIGAAYIGITLIAWLLFAPLPTTPQMLAMLFAHACAGMFLFQGFAVITSVIAPRRAAYKDRFSHQMSAGAWAMMLLALAVMLVLPLIVRARLLPGPLLDYWWAAFAGLAVAVLVYVLMLRVAERLLVRRRERILALVEGRS